MKQFFLSIQDETLSRLASIVSDEISRRAPLIDGKVVKLSQKLALTFKSEKKLELFLTQA